MGIFASHQQNRHEWGFDGCILPTEADNCRLKLLLTYSDPGKEIRRIYAFDCIAECTGCSSAACIGICCHRGSEQVNDNGWASGNRPQHVHSTFLKFQSEDR